MWHICDRLPLSLSKLLEFRLFLLEELPDCWKRNSLAFKRTNRHSVFVTSMVRHFVTHCLSQPSVSFEIMVKWLNQQALIYGESCKCRVFSSSIIGISFLIFLFAFIFFFNFYLLKKNSTSCKKTCRSYFNQKWFWIFIMNSFCRPSILSCYSAIQVSISWWVRGYFVKSLWCGIGAKWDMRFIIIHSKYFSESDWLKAHV